jgi:hypothetical protein
MRTRRVRVGRAVDRKTVAQAPPVEAVRCVTPARLGDLGLVVAGSPPRRPRPKRGRSLGSRNYFRTAHAGDLGVGALNAESTVSPGIGGYRPDRRETPGADTARHDRLGVGDATVWRRSMGTPGRYQDRTARTGDAYSRTSDLGLLGETLWTGGMGASGHSGGRRPTDSPTLAERLPDVPSLLETRQARPRAVEVRRRACPAPPRPSRRRAIRLQLFSRSLNR